MPLFVAPPPFKSDTWYIPSGGNGPLPLIPLPAIFTVGRPLPVFSASKPRDSFRLKKKIMTEFYISSIIVRGYYSL